MHNKTQQNMNGMRNSGDIQQLHCTRNVYFGIEANVWNCIIFVFNNGPLPNSYKILEFSTRICNLYHQQIQGAVSISRCCLTSIGIPILKIRRSNDPYLGKTGLYIGRGRGPFCLNLSSGARVCEILQAFLNNVIWSTKTRMSKWFVGKCSETWRCGERTDERMERQIYKHVAQGILMSPSTWFRTKMWSEMNIFKNSKENTFCDAVTWISDLRPWMSSGHYHYQCAW